MQNLPLRLICVVVALVAVMTTPLRGLRAQRSAVDIYAITGARIVTISGPVIERGTIVIRNGLIQSVGANTIAPADARVIDGTGLTVYPGLIDAYTSLGLPTQAPSTPTRFGAPAATASPQPTPQSSQFSSLNPTQPVGLQPEIQAIDFVRPGGTEIEAARTNGITTALTAPREGIFMGQSALINLDGASATEMTVRAPVAMHIGFTPLRAGVYPASLLGVFSALRQMLLDAERLRIANLIYEKNPRGLRRPEQDRSLVALFPVLARQMPVVMFANTEREIRRALDLAEEFNLRVIIAGGAESWKVTDRLKARDVPVLLSLNFPRRTTAQSSEADPEPLRILRSRVEAPRAAARLAAAGVRFAFQDGAMTNMADFLTNASRAVEQGLPRDEAVRALTIRPAEIFGVADRLGSIEAGKIANLVVVRGDLFDRNRTITHVFIDGRPVDLRPVTPSTGGGALATGTWTLNVNLGEGDVAATLTLEQQGERLSGSIQGALGSAQIANGSVGANGDIRFTAPLTIGGLTTEATFSGTITGNEMRGTVQIVGRSPGSFTGTRPNAPPSAAPTASPPNQSQPQPSPTPGMSTTLVGASSADDKFTGTWSIQFIIGSEKVPATLKLRREGTRLSGTLEGPFPATEIRDGTAGTKGFQFTSTVTLNGQAVEMTFTGNIITVTNDGGKPAGYTDVVMNGTATSSLGYVSFSGLRLQESEK